MALQQARQRCFKQLQHLCNRWPDWSVRPLRWQPAEKFRRRGACATDRCEFASRYGPATPSVLAAPDLCAASEVAKTVAEVATYTGNYLEANPKANQALTRISQQQGGPQSALALKTYFDANPQVAADLQRLQQPLASLSGRCKMPVTVPQMLGLMQAAQQQSFGASHD